MSNRLLERIGPYRILEKLGEGGMGIVYRAQHESIARVVAIKVLHPFFAGTPEFMNRFFNEARAVNLVDHPGLVQVSDFGQLSDGTAYLVMEFLKGEPLSRRLAEQGGFLSLSDVLNIGWQLADSLAAAHAKQIVHRDLKPDKVSPVEKVAKTSQPPRENCAEVGSPPKPPEALRCASVAKLTDRRPP